MSTLLLLLSVCAGSGQSDLDRLSDALEAKREALAAAESPEERRAIYRQVLDTKDWR